MASAVTVYGLSSEGYAVATALARKFPTTIIDEHLHMGLELRADVVAAHPTLDALMAEEPLLRVTPLAETVARARLIVFAPRIRRLGEEGKAEVLTQLRDVAKTLNRGAVLVQCVPFGLGGNAEVLGLIEKMSGLVPGPEFQYVYAPSPPGNWRPIAVGYAPAKADKRVSDLFVALGIKVMGPSIEAAEAVHARRVLAESAFPATGLEVVHRVGERGERDALRVGRRNGEPFLDDLAQRAFDLRMLVASLDTGDPLLYLATGMLRCLDGYVKHLVEELRAVLREHELRASKTRLILLWSLDQYELRGDRLALQRDLQERLRDYIGDVETRSLANPAEAALPANPDRVTLLLTCSQADQRRLGELGRRRLPPGSMVLRANSLVERSGG